MTTWNNLPLSKHETEKGNPFLTWDAAALARGVRFCGLNRNKQPLGVLSKDIYLSYYLSNNILFIGHITVCQLLSHQGYLEPSAAHSMGRAGGQSHGVSDSLRSSQPEKNQVPNPGPWLPDPAMAVTSSLVSIPKVLCHPKLSRDSNYQRLLALCRVRCTLPLSYVGGNTLMA